MKKLVLIVGGVVVLAAVGVMVRHRVAVHAHPLQTAAAGQALAQSQAVSGSKGNIGRRRCR